MASVEIVLGARAEKVVLCFSDSKFSRFDDLVGCILSHDPRSMTSAALCFSEALRVLKEYSSDVLLSDILIHLISSGA